MPDSLMDLNRKQSFIKNGNFYCKEPYEQGTMLPEQDKIVCNSQTCDVIHNYDDGIGLGRQYVTIMKSHHAYNHLNRHHEFRIEHVCSRHTMSKMLI